MAKPKLALIPAAQGTKFYSVLPSDGSGDFTFNRGSVGTRINAQGLIENVASGQSRLDYPMIDGVQKGCPHHILEPARTNVLLQSNGFGTPPWSVGNSIVTPNSEISPSGNLDAWKIQSTAVNSETRVRQSYSYTIGNIVTLSCYMKAGTVNFGIIRTYAISGGGRVWFDLENGVVGTKNTGLTGKIENYGNGWYRCSITGTIDTTGAIDFAPSYADNEYLSNAVGENIYIFGGQLEINSSYLTSYIPTTSTSVTRSAETATGAGNSTTFNSEQGVLMAEISALVNSDVSRYMTISDGTTSNRIIFDCRPTQNVLRVVLVVTTSQYSYDITFNDITSNNKVAFKYKENDLALWVNGIKVNTSLSANVPTENTFDRLNFSASSGTVPFYGKTKQIQYFDLALADTQLEQLTSWQSFRDMANGQLYTIE